jgi:hypothetical protein
MKMFKIIEKLKNDVYLIFIGVNQLLPIYQNYYIYIKICIYRFDLFFHFCFCADYFWGEQFWGWNSEPHTCKAKILELSYTPSHFLLLLINFSESFESKLLCYRHHDILFLSALVCTP